MHLLLFSHIHLPAIHPHRTNQATATPNHHCRLVKPLHELRSFPSLCSGTPKEGFSKTLMDCNTLVFCHQGISSLKHHSPLTIDHSLLSIFHIAGRWLHS